MQRQIKAMTNLLRRIFDEDLARPIGRHGELMFDAALGRNAFRAEGMNYKLLQLQEQAGDPRSDRSSGQFAGELQEEPLLFHF